MVERIEVDVVNLTISAVRPGPWQRAGFSLVRDLPVRGLYAANDTAVLRHVRGAVLVVWQVRQAATVGELAMSSVMAVRSVPACIVTASRLTGSRP